MSSINTNVAAMTALQTLTETNKSLTETQKRISTGFRVARCIRQRRLLVDRDHDALRQCGPVHRSGRARPRCRHGRRRLHRHQQRHQGGRPDQEQAGRRPPARLDRGKIQSEITELQKQLTQHCQTRPSFSGENWLSVDSAPATYNATKNIVASFTRTGGAVSDPDHHHRYRRRIKLFDANAGHDQAAAGILDAKRKTTNGRSTIPRRTFTVDGLNISALTDSAADLTTLDSYIRGADTAIKAMTTAAASLGAVKSRIGMQQDFVKSLMDAIDRGIGQLVDADMNEESTKLQALQVKQQLGIQALSIANSSSQNILRLFQ